MHNNFPDEMLDFVYMCVLLLTNAISREQLERQLSSHCPCVSNTNSVRLVSIAGNCKHLLRTYHQCNLDVEIFETKSQ